MCVYCPPSVHRVPATGQQAGRVWVESQRRDRLLHSGRQDHLGALDRATASDWCVSLAELKINWGGGGGWGHRGDEDEEWK